MNSNVQIENLFRELKQTLAEIDETGDDYKKQELEKYADELRSNIDELAGKVELDYELLGKTMLFKATANAILYRICNRNELHTIICDLYELGVPREIMTADKEVLTRYLRQIEHPQPTKYERYHDFIRIVQSKSFKTSPLKKQEFIKDFHWLMSEDSLAASTMESFNIDSDQFHRIIGSQEEEDFELLVDRYLQLMTL